MVARHRIVSLLLTVCPEGREIVSLLVTLPRLDGMSVPIVRNVIAVFRRFTMFNEKFKTAIKILVVDNDAAIRSSFSALLTEIGYVIRTAGDGLEALAAIRMDIPNILLSDLNMPEMSGFELLSMVRQSYPSIQII